MGLSWFYPYVTRLFLNTNPVQYRLPTSRGGCGPRATTLDVAQNPPYIPLYFHSPVRISMACPISSEGLYIAGQVCLVILATGSPCTYRPDLMTCRICASARLIEDTGQRRPGPVMCSCSRRAVLHARAVVQMGSR